MNSRYRPERRLVAARTQTSDVLARLDEFKHHSRRLGCELGGRVSDVLTNPIITPCATISELARREGEWGARFGRDHLA